MCDLSAVVLTVLHLSSAPLGTAEARVLISDCFLAFVLVLETIDISIPSKAKFQSFAALR